MAWVDSFKQRFSEIFPVFFPEGKQRVRVIATYSVDSVVSVAFLIKAFQSLSYSFSCSFYRKITDSVIAELSKSQESLLIFVNPYVNLGELSVKKQVVVFGHYAENSGTEIKIISTENFNINEKIPTSSLLYLACKERCQEISNLSYLLTIPYFDIETPPPDELLHEAFISRKLEVRKGITILSSQTMPVHKAIANTLCPYLPGISGSEDNAVQLLLENNIPLRENNRFRRVVDLREDETKKLLTAIMLRRLGSEKNPELVLGNTYILAEEDENSFIKDLKCFNFLVSCCLAYSKPSLAVDICLNPQNKSKALEHINNATIALVSAAEKYIENKKSFTDESGTIAILKIGSALEPKFLSMFTRIMLNSNIFPSKMLAVLVDNPLNSIIAQIEPPEPVYSKMALGIARGIQKMMPAELEITDNITITVQQESEELFLSTMLSHSEMSKIEEKISA